MTGERATTYRDGMGLRMCNGISPCFFAFSVR